LDSDNDGVADAIDNCPGTALNAPVDGSGCAFFDGVIEGVNFETGSARLTDDASLILEGVSATMLQNPDIRVTIEASSGVQLTLDFQIIVLMCEKAGLSGLFAFSLIDRVCLNARRLSIEFPTARSSTVM